MPETPPDRPVGRRFQSSKDTPAPSLELRTVAPRPAPPPLSQPPKTRTRSARLALSVGLLFVFTMLAGVLAALILILVMGGAGSGTESLRSALRAMQDVPDANPEAPTETLPPLPGQRAPVGGPVTQDKPPDEATTPEAPSTTLSVMVDDPDTTHVLLTCGGYRNRLPVRAGRAEATDVPPTETCMMRFQGGPTASFQGARSGRHYECRFEPPSAICTF
jgi:hypothetical protein